jgi:hypothetical protein
MLELMDSPMDKIREARKTVSLSPVGGTVAPGASDTSGEGCGEGSTPPGPFLQHFPEDRLLDALAGIHTISRYLRSRLRVIRMILQLQTSRGIPDDTCDQATTNVTQRPQPALISYTTPGMTSR